MSRLDRVVFDQDIIPPSVPIIGTATALSETSIRVTWNATTDTGGSGLAGYRVYRATAAAGPFSFLAATSTASLVYDDLTLSAVQTRYYRVTAYDNAGNESAPSGIVNAVTPDQTAPSRPGTPAGTALSSNSISWVWALSADNVGVSGYRVYLDGSATPITTTTGNTYTSTGHAANSTHTLRVIAFDAAGNSTQSFLGSQSTGQLSISWNPGFYVLGTGTSQHSTSILDQARTANPKGYEQIVSWSTIETSRGVYTWTYTDQLFADCKARSLRLILQIWQGAFSGTATTALPAYLATELAGQPGYYHSSDGGYWAKVWRSEIMDRFLLLLQAVATRYGSDAMFEGIRNGESSLAADFDAETDWSAANYLTQYLRLIAALPSYLPTSNAWVALNYGFPQATFPTLLDAMVANRCGMCGPDVWTGNSDNSTNGDRACRGLIWDPTAASGAGAWVAGGTDYRPLIPILHDWQRPELGGKEGSPSFATLYAFDVGTNKSNHGCVSAKDTASTPSRAAPDDYYFDNTTANALADPNKYTQDLKSAIAAAGSLVTTKPSVYSSVITGATGSGQLLAGHFWDPSGTVFQSMYAVYPRPDAEANTYARHRKAYYDGTNAVLYEVDLGVQFGAFPYWYEKIAGPSWLSVGQFYGDVNYGRAYGTPTGSVTNTTVTIRVHDQLGATIDVTWTLSTSSSTTDIIFCDPVGGNDTTGTGSIGAPYKTLLKLFGASENTTTFPNRIVYARSGTLALYDMGTGFGIHFSNGRTPMALVGFPGETVNIDQTGAGSVCGFNCGNGTGDDLYLRGLTFINRPAATTGSWYSFRVGENQSRTTFDLLSFPNAFKGDNAGDNSACITYRSVGGGVQRQHTFIHNCSCTNFGSVGTGGNAWGLSCIFTTNRVLVSNCSDLLNRSERAICYLKDSGANAEIRESTATMSGASVAILTGTQPAGGGNAGPTLIRHNKLDAGSASTGTGISLDESQNGQGGSTIKQTYVVRNSIRRGTMSANGPATATYGPYVLQDNIGDTSQSIVQRNYANQTLGNYTTSIGNVAVLNAFDTNILLTGASRTTHLGLKGAEIG